MNPTGISQFNQARIEWAIRLKYSPIPNLDMEVIAGQLNDMRIGELRTVGKTFEIMLERDPELAVNSDKRKSDAAGLQWQVISDGSLVGDRHAEALTYLYNNLTATHALEQDSTGGADQLIYQTLSALDNYYSVHEMLLRVDNPAAKEVTFEFRHTPMWFMEARRGYLGYLQHIFDLYGQPCKAGEWLTCVNSGWMRSLSLVYVLKATALRDWAVFNERYGSGYLVGKTGAPQDSTEWLQALQAMQTLANDGAVLVNEAVTLEFLAQTARNNLPFEPMVKWCNEIYSKCYRGIDLATSSKGGGQNNSGQGGSGAKPMGASIQKEESGIFQVRDAFWLSGVFNERIDRPAIRYLFNQEPRAWFALLPPESDTSPQILAAVQALVPMGLRIALKDIYKAFRFRVPDPDEPCLMPAVGAAPASGDPQDEPGNGAPGAARAKPAAPAAPVLPVEPPKQDDGLTQPARTDDNTVIAPGADPATNPSLRGPAGNRAQTADRGMPDTQVDAGSFWSRAGLMPAGADGRPLPAPSLGYALPNETLEKLTRLGLGNSRAAQALSREIRKQRSESRRGIALANQRRRTAAAGPTPEQSADFLSAVAKDLAPLRNRVAAIQKITDPALQRAKWQELHQDMDRIKANVLADPTSARVLEGIMAEGVVKGMASNPALPNGDVPGHEFHGNQYTEIPDEKWTGTPKEMRNRAKALLKGHPPVTHPALGTISFSSHGVDKSVSYQTTPHGLQATGAIPQLIPKGKLTSSEPDMEGRKGIKAFHTLEAPLKIGDTRYNAKIVIKESTDGTKTENRFYLHKLEGEK